MTEKQIQQIIQNKSVPDSSEQVELIETHISWVLMTDHFVYKIKKPLAFSFLDFSTLGKRAFYCQRELDLNQRLAPDIYLDVLPIIEEGGEVKIVEMADLPIDFCVRMKKMDPSRLMRLLLEKGEVTTDDIVALAIIIATFHQEVEVLHDAIQPESLQKDFNDILNYDHLASQFLGEKALWKIRDCVAFSDQFLQGHHDRIIWRDQQGFTRDCHGDLHAGNIFILDQPVVFDCIEFNDHFRHIDVINELAFFSMDLEFYGYPELSSVFMDTYLEHHRCILNETDMQLWFYYKFYRANVKLKVNLIKTSNAEDPEVFNQRLQLAKDYYELLGRYHSELATLKSEV